MLIVFYWVICFRWSYRRLWLGVWRVVVIIMFWSLCLYLFFWREIVLRSFCGFGIVFVLIVIFSWRLFFWNFFSCNIGKLWNFLRSWNERRGRWSFEGGNLKWWYLRIVENGGILFWMLIYMRLESRGNVVFGILCCIVFVMLYFILISILIS